MNPPSTLVRQILSWFITLLIPFLLIITSVRIMLLPIFLQFEYHTPNFPQDSYGFTITDRLHWATLVWDYSLNNAGISFLGDLRFTNGDPVFNDRELSHLVDVKNVVQVFIKAWIIGLGILFLLGIWAWRGSWLSDFRLGINRGGWVTIGLIIAILIAVVVNFSVLFTDFHRLFFTGNSWLFLYTDTLIRLYPIRFWQDCFIDMGIFSIICGVILGIFLRK